LGLEDEAPPALDHVQVAAPAGCEARARWFYGELLGLDEVEKPPPLAGAQLHVGAVSEGFAPALKAHPGLRIGTVARLEMLGRRLAAVGARVEWDSSLPGVSRFFTADPFGNRLELLARKA
jgi:catechol 2,3-dioxygenase-like lactoylglutathione lyase family enzyme